MRFNYSQVKIDWTGDSRVWIFGRLSIRAWYTTKHSRRIGVRWQVLFFGHPSVWITPKNGAHSIFGAGVSFIGMTDIGDKENNNV